jgi:glutaminase
MPASQAPPFVSTGTLPDRERVRALVDQAHRRYRTDSRGEVSRVYPALSRTDPDRFGVCVVSVTGTSYPAGDADVMFTMMSIAKPFVFALACHTLGPQPVRRRVGVNATGMPFDSLIAVEQSGDGRTNPMVNPGAIATTSLVPGATHEAKWRFLQDGLSRFAGRQLDLDDEVYESASTTNQRNRSIAHLLHAMGLLGCPPEVALDLYTRQSCLRVCTTDLAVMGATLADAGVNPVTGEPVVDGGSCHHTLVVMTTAGLYETSGDWLFDVGLPGKSGIGGGIVTVSPGKGGLGTYAPLLDAAGNSVKGRLATTFLSRQLGLDLFTAAPA